MDDTAQNPPQAQDPQQPVTPLNQSADTPIVGEIVEQPAVTPLIQSPPSAPQHPIGGMNKEFGPVSNATVEMPMSEVLQPTEQAPVLEKEVAEAGVEVSKNPEVVDLTMHDQKHTGLSHAAATIPVPTGPTDAIKIPITEEKAQEIVKKEKKPKNAITWIAVMVLRQLQVMHAKMKGETHEH